MKKRNPFHFKQFTVEQQNNVMPVTTDACLFGAYCDFSNCKNILDIGTGTGLLSLMLAQRFPEAKITGLEIDESSAHLAAFNFQNSVWKNNLNVIHADIFSPAFTTSFDGIICNPPFFENQLAGADGDQNRARHSNSDFYKKLVDIISKLLTQNGIAWLLIPFIHVAKVEDLISENELFIKNKTSVSASPKHPPHLYILCVGRSETTTTFDSILTYEKTGIYAEKTMELLKPYYLNL